jgi:hypothetical protein
MIGATDTSPVPRKYSVSEIDQMRSAVSIMFPITYNAKAAEIEDRLRTYMIAGTDPDELEQSAKEYRKRDFEAFAQNQKIAAEQRNALDCVMMAESRDAHGGESW